MLSTTSQTGMGSTLTKSPTGEDAFKKCRQHFKRDCQEKLRLNVIDDDDRCMISKKFWSHLKSASNTTRIPQTVNYNGKYRSNPKDQANLFNTYFQDQFSCPSNYRTPGDFTNDHSDF